LLHRNSSTLFLSVKRTVGLLWLNSAETWVDIDSSEDNKGVLNTLFGYFAGEEPVPEVNPGCLANACFFRLAILVTLSLFCIDARRK